MHGRTITSFLLAVFLFGGRGSAQSIVSQVNWGSPSFNSDPASCPFMATPGLDIKSWPVYGTYSCPGGAQGNLQAWPDPLRASGEFVCASYIKWCQPVFTDPIRGVDGEGPYALVSVIERSFVNGGCQVFRETAVKSHTNRIWSNENLCVCNPCTQGYVQDCGDAGWISQDQCGCYTCVLTPIIFSIVDGARPTLSSPENGVLFDTCGSGRRERIPWPEPANDAAWLVLDRNKNGFVDDGTELFGNSTALNDGNRAANGYVALSELDANHDGQIDATDPRYAELRAWIDANRNGWSEPGELHAMSEIGLTSFSTLAAESRQQDRWGNLYRLRSETTWMSAPLQRFSYDVFLLAAPRRP